VESVKLMAEKLDPEQLGIITFETFVDEFYPGLFSASAEDAVRPFTVYHYNGLNRSTLAKVITECVSIDSSWTVDGSVAMSRHHHRHHPRVVSE